MEFIADFHVHSKYSRATSPDMNIEIMSAYAEKKGIKLLGTGDFTHYGWLAELKEKLKPLGNGLFSHGQVNFMLTAEVSNIFTVGDRVKKIHSLIFAPNFESVERINSELRRFGKLDSDGRPVFGMNVTDLLKIVLEADKRNVLIPAHAWTPWFSVLGSRSGFDSVEECFGNCSKYIFCIETGLSSDPAMNWRVSSLDKYALISNSDAHSPSKIGREACVFNAELSYDAVIDALKSRDNNKFRFTIEFFPEEGKYHYDGHRNCSVSMNPADSIRKKNICHVCGKGLTVGVLHRVEQLADREEGYVPDSTVPFRSCVPLEEIISSVTGRRPESQAVGREYGKLLGAFGTEFNVLLNVGYDELRRETKKEIADAVINVREKRVRVTPGYDGVYGRVDVS